MAPSESILIAHFDSEILAGWRKTLEKEGFKVTATTSGADVLKRVEAQRPDAVVLDPMLQRLNGLAVLSALKGTSASSTVPVIVVLDDGDGYTEGRAQASGADALLKRPGDGAALGQVLVAKIRTVLAEKSLAAGGEPELRQESPLERFLNASAEAVRAENPVIAHISDAITGLYNSGYFGLKLAEEFKRARRFQVPLSLALLRVGISDHASDEKDPAWRSVLNEVAGVILCESRDIDVLARLDDATFAMLLPHTDGKGAVAMAQRILGQVRRPFGSLPDGAVLSAHVGVSEYGTEGLDGPDELKRRAFRAVSTAVGEKAEAPMLWTPKADDQA